MTKRFTYIPPKVEKVCKACNTKITKRSNDLYLCEGSYCNESKIFKERPDIEMISGSLNSFFLSEKIENNKDLVKGDIKKIMTPFYELQTNIFLKTPNTPAEEEVIKKFWEQVYKEAPLPTIGDTWREMVYKVKRWFKHKKQ